MFRDGYETLTKTGLAIYALSADSPKSNTTFKTKQNLPYTMLCDPPRKLIKAVGLENAGKTARGVVVISKDGEMVLSLKGGPQATVDAVEEYVKGM